MKVLKNFGKLLSIIWKDKVDVAMLLIWLAFIVYLYVKANSFDQDKDKVVVDLLNNAWAGAAFFWVYGFTSQLRIAWHKIQLAKKDGK